MKSNIQMFLLFMLVWLVFPSPAKIASGVSVDPYSYTTLIGLFYQGGSLQYHGGDPSLCHLKSGNFYPFRLSKLTKATSYDVTIGTDFYPVYDEFEDLSDQAEFGYLTVDNINTSAISFRYTLYSANGSIRYSNEVINISLSNSCDLNGDGVPDVNFTNQLRSDKPVNNNVIYLHFISSKTTLTTSMYSYMPDYFPSLNQMGGHLGYNDNGYAVIRPLMETGLRKAAVGSCPIANGDFIFNYDEFCFSRYTGVNGLSKTSATNILSMSNTQPVNSIDDVLPLVYLDASSVMSTDNKFQFFTSKSEFQTMRNELQTLQNRYNTQEKLIDTKLVYKGDGYEAGLTELKGSIGVDCQFSNTWGGKRGYIKCLVLLDNVLGIHTNKKINLYNYDHRFADVPVCTALFMVWVIPMGVSFNLTSGYKATIDLENNKTFGLRSCFAVVAENNFTLSIKNVSQSTTGNYKVIGCPEIDMSTVASASFKIDFGCAVAIFVQPINARPVYAQLGVSANAGPSASFTVQNGNTLNGTISVDAGLSVPFKLGSDWLHNIKILGWQCPYEWSTNLFSYNRNLWSYSLITPIKYNSNGQPVFYWLSEDFSGLVNRRNAAVSGIIPLLMNN